MEIVFMEKSIFDALKKEILCLTELVTEITTPYKRLQDTPKWLDNQEVCQLLDISKRTLQTYKDKGLLTASCINRKNYFKYADVAQLLQQGYKHSKVNGYGTAK